MVKKQLPLSILFTVISGLILAQTNSLPFKDVTNSHLKSTNTRNNTMDAQAIDIDQDGDLDLVMAMEYVENVLLINDGTGKLIDESGKRLPRLRHDSEDIATGDFDQDGDMDIIFVSEDDQINEFYENIGNGYFKNRPDIIPVKGISNSVEAIDIDEDGDLDLIIGNEGQNVLLINAGKAEFVDETNERLPKNSFTTQDVEIGDIDGDGDPDIVEGNETYNRILINNGSGFFTDESSKRLPKINDQTREVDLGDLDNDGDLDLAFANVDFGGFGNPQNRLLLNDGNGYFKDITHKSLPPSNFRTVDIDFFDINQDGKLDILSGNRFNQNNTIVLIQGENMIFEDKTNDYLPPLNMYVFDFQVADFNGDGVQDIYLCGFRGQDKLLFGQK